MQMTYVSPNTGTVARWSGGEYIDLGYFLVQDVGLMSAAYDGPDTEFVALDCINVWDHAADRSSIPFTMDALAAEVEEWIEENED